MRGTTGIGTDTAIDRILAEYFPSQDRQTLLGEIFEDETNALLAALILENSGMALDEESSEVRQTANYYAETFTVGPEGPAEQDAEEINGKRVDLGFVAGEVDLRFSGPITVGFNRPGKNSHREITYEASRDPVTEIPAATRYVWLQAADAASESVTVQMEAWP